MSAAVVFVNPGSGTKETSVEDLAEAFGDLAQVQAFGDDLVVDVRRALDNGAPWIGVAGGDGSLRVAAPLLAAAGRPLLPVPCGTRNHFAKDAGLSTIEDSVAAARLGRPRAVDLAWVNDECFLNTCSVGMYAEIVKERVRHEGRLPKRLADTIGVLRQGARGHRLRLELDSERVVTWGVFIGNGRYGDNLGSLSRDCLDDGLLDVRVVMANQRVARLRLIGALIGGRLHRTPVLNRACQSSLLVRNPGDGPFDVAVDGDLCQLRSPLKLRIAERSLMVLGPALPEQ